MGAIVNMSTKLRSVTPEVSRLDRVHLVIVHLVIRSNASNLRGAPEGTPKEEFLSVI